MVIRLNLGCGVHAPEGWTNIDRTPNLLLRRAPLVKSLLRRMRVLDSAHMVEWPASVVRHDVRRRFPYSDASVDAIYSSHTLEHLYLDDARRVLEECQRVLRPGGILRLALPDAGMWARDLLDGVTFSAECPGLEFNARLAAHPFHPPSARRRLLGLVGSPTHRWQPTEDLVVWLFESAGFVDVTRRTFREGSLPDLASVEVREESLFVESAAP